MKPSSIFLESFLDGFGIAGFGAKLRRPGAPTRLFAAEDDEIGEKDPETSIAANALRESLDSGDLRKAEDAARVFVRLMGRGTTPPPSLARDLNHPGPKTSPSLSMPTPDRSLAPRASELSGLPPEVAVSIVKLANDSDARATKYAIVGMVCGTLSFLGCVADYAYLVTQNHPEAAAVALGTGVLAIIRTMIKSRR